MSSKWKNGCSLVIFFIYLCEENESMMQEMNTERYRDNISVYGEHPKAGQNTQTFDEINKVMCNM